LIRLFFTKLAQVPVSTEALAIKESGAVILLSGGLDSATCLYLAAKKFSEKSKGKLPLIALSFLYQQKHKIEISKAKSLAKQLKIPHLIQKLDPHFFKGSSLTESALKVPKNSNQSSTVIPNTYVPARNTLFLSFALALAEGSGFSEIYIGVNALDYSGYPDCRPEFIKAYQEMANLGTKKGVSNKEKIKIQTPLIHLTKKEIILLAQDLKVPFHLTHSCYDPIKGKPCGKCDSCYLRRKGFEEAGVEDF
jgi:7-cyano-7-deazaguanine synthase